MYETQGVIRFGRLHRTRLAVYYLHDLHVADMSPSRGGSRQISDEQHHACHHACTGACTLHSGVEFTIEIKGVEKERELLLVEPLVSRYSTCTHLVATT